MGTHRGGWIGPLRDNIKDNLLTPTKTMTSLKQLAKGGNMAI